MLNTLFVKNFMVYLGRFNTTQIDIMSLTETWRSIARTRKTSISISFKVSRGRSAVMARTSG